MSYSRQKSGKEACSFFRLFIMGAERSHATLQAWSALGFVLALLGSLCVWLMPACAGEARAAEANFVKPGDMRSGALLMPAVETGRYVEAPLLATDVDVTVSGPVARSRITQYFINPAKGWVEGVYVFPLPENSAVDTLKMVVGKRSIVGEIKERQTAKQIYEKAKAEGKKAGLLEQERPNIFTSSVANIGPGETVVVQIEYQQTVAQSGGTFSLRVPLVVAPRYNPKPAVQTVDFSADGSGFGQVNEPVSDRDRIEPPVLDPRIYRPTNPVTLAVRLQAGFPLGEVKSHYHGVQVEKVSDDTQIIKLDGGAVPADKDFELTWQAKEGKAPSAGLFKERVGNDDYLLAFVTPPALPDAGGELPREIVFVIDNSGSMGGTSIVQAKASLIYALQRLKPQDRFNIIRFDDTMDQLFPGAVPADAAHVAQAKSFVEALEARGGTEMVPAMAAALIDKGNAQAATLRQVVFLTDGAIGNEDQLFSTITAGLGRSRIFMVGIGSAPNAFLMTHAAELGRGTYTYIGSVDQVQERMRELFAKLEKPAVTSLSIKFSSGKVDVTPAILPDLYAGEPLQIAAKVSRASGQAEITGMIGNRPWVVTLPVANAAEGKGISKLWARRKITDAEAAISLRQMPKEAADKRILSLALDHQLVSRLTSLVAIDKTPSRPANARLTRADIPLNLPSGWDFDTVFGDQKQRPAERDTGGGNSVTPFDAGLIDAVATSAAPRPVMMAANQAGNGVMLPKTATQAPLFIRFGAALWILSLLLAAFAWLSCKTAG